MAYIFTKKQYVIANDLSDDLVDLSREVSVKEIDELMAYPLQLLNRKGYLTEGSCSGHAYGSLCYREISSADNTNLLNNKPVLTIKENGDGQIFACYIDAPPNYAHILFQDNYLFSETPEGWTYQNQMLCYALPTGENPISYYKEVIYGLETLVEWIATLPNKNNNV